MPKTKELVIANQLEIPAEQLDAIDEIIKRCKPVVTLANQSLKDSLVIANGLLQMKAFFKNNDIRKLVDAMQDSHLGFLTDRNPIALFKAEKSWKKIKAYNYDQIVEALIPCMLKGYSR